jgi:hypothetical protein
MRAVDQYAQSIKQFRYHLDLVKDNEPLKGAEHKFGILQALEIRLRLEIKMNGRFIFGKHTGESGLAALTRSEEGRDRRALCRSR